MKNLQILFATVFFIWSTQIVPAQTSAPEEDTQNWNEIQVAFPVSNKLDINLFGQLRFGSNFRDFVDEHIGAGIGFTYKPKKYLQFAPSYTYIVNRPSPNTNAIENRLSLPATIISPKFHGFTISNRNLLERRLRKPVNSWRYRNRLQIERTFKPKNFEFRLFASDEVFYDFRARSWVRNRFTIGVGKPISKQLSFDVYYLRQNDGRSRPGGLHVVGTGLKVRF
jgi:hypothetical protein